MRPAALLLAAVALGGCGGGEEAATTAATTTAAAAGRCEPAPPALKTGVDAAPPARALEPDREYQVIVKTNCGDFTITLDVETSPKTTASFVALARANFFDKTMFHRVVRGFVIQGGDPTASGQGGPGYTTVDKPPADTVYTKGVVAMAKTQAEPAGTAGSQFFVATGPGLTPDYAIVGKVTSGFDVVKKIEKLGDPTDPSGTPMQIVVIEKACVKGG